MNIVLQTINETFEFIVGYEVKDQNNLTQFSDKVAALAFLHRIAAHIRDLSVLRTILVKEGNGINVYQLNDHQLLEVLANRLLYGKIKVRCTSKSRPPSTTGIVPEPPQYMTPQEVEQLEKKTRRGERRSISNATSVTEVIPVVNKTDEVSKVANKTSEVAKVPNSKLLTGQVEYGKTDLSQIAIDYAKNKNIKGAINIAVFEYKDSDGAVKTITRASQRGKGHSEKLIAEELKKLGIPNKNVTRIYSELAPCSAPGGFCKSMIEQGSKKSKLGPFNNAKVTYSIEYGGTPHDPAKAAKGIEELKRLRKLYSQGGNN